MGRASLLAAALGLLTSGCSLLFGDVEKTECRTDDDCPPLEICREQTLCVEGVRDLDLDRGPVDVGPEAMPDEGPETTPDAMPDAIADAMPDAVPDADPGVLVFGALADCFDGSPGGSFEPDGPPVGALHVPRAACTPFARLWTARAEDGVELAWDLDGDGTSEGRFGLDGRYAVGEGVVFAPGRRGPDGRRVLVRVDLRTLEETAVRPGPVDHRDPVVARGRLAFVEAVAGQPSGIVVVETGDDAELVEWDCAVAGRAQWGPALGPGYVAWFEQPVGSRRTRLVVLDDRICAIDSPRRQKTLDAALPTDARLFATETGLVWLEPRTDAPGNLIRRWRFDDPAADVETLYLEDRALRVDPARAPVEGGNPIELVAHGHRLGVVSYLPVGGLRYVLSVVDFTAPRERAVTAVLHDGDARAPWLSASYLLWAEPDRLGNWRVAYEELD